MADELHPLKEGGEHIYNFSGIHKNRFTHSLGPRPNQPQHGSLLEAIHALDKRSGNETSSPTAAIARLIIYQVHWYQHNQDANQII